MAVRDKSKRIKFPPKKQGLFIERCRARIGCTLKELAIPLGVSTRTVTDWKREKFLISAEMAQKLSRRAEVPLPRGGEMRDRFWYTKKGARRGGLAVYKKYGRIGGDPETRKKKWYEWWSGVGKHQNRAMFHRLPFKRPVPSIYLAEFMGIMIGDGGMSKGQITITLHHVDDLAYGKFVKKLMKKLFGVQPSTYHNAKDSVNNIVMSRRGVVEFLHGFGLPIGNKIRQAVDIPRWIRSNPRYEIACVRGLVDTDGSVFTHSYRVNGKLYSYKKLAFTSKSSSLLRSVHEIMRACGLRPRIAERKGDVRLDGIEDMEKYFVVFGSNNPKHLKRYCA